MDPFSVRDPSFETPCLAVPSEDDETAEEIFVSDRVALRFESDRRAPAPAPECTAYAPEARASKSKLPPREFAESFLSNTAEPEPKESLGGKVFDFSQVSSGKGTSATANATAASAYAFSLAPRAS